MPVRSVATRCRVLRATVVIRYARYPGMRSSHFDWGHGNGDNVSGGAREGRGVVGTPMGPHRWLVFGRQSG